jgi:hypothetical protein
MDAEAERRVPVDLAVDDDLVRPVELGRVPAGRRVRQQDPVVGLHVGPAPAHVLLDQPGHGDRGVGPEELLDRGRQQPGIGDEPPAVGGSLRQMPEGGSDRAPGGVDAGDEQQGHRADDVRRVELATLEFRVDQVGREVVARVCEVVLNLREQVVEERRHPGQTLLRWQVDAFQGVFHELAELRRVLRGEPENAGYHPHRDVLRVVAGGVDDVPALERVDERVAQLHRRRLLLADRGLRECREQEPARLPVERGVGGDRRRAAGWREVR